MPSLPNSLLSAVAAVAFWICLGLPLARRIATERALASALAPAIGWAVFNAAAVPIFLAVGLTRSSAALLCSAALTLALAFWRADGGDRGPSIAWWAFGLALLLALVPTLALLPKSAGSAVLLSEPVYDHAKVAMIDGIARQGLPPANPFFGEAGAPGRLAYYYLWHAGAALFATLFGVSGWEADIGMTAFTAFAALAAMMGLAVWLGGRGAALWVPLLSLAGSLRPVLDQVLGPDTASRILAPDQGLQGFLVQATWVPQHLAAATSIIVAVFLISRLGIDRGRLLVPVLALLVAAAFESSTWIGGVTFACAAPPIALAAFGFAPPGVRLRFLGSAALAGVFALTLAWPFLHDEFLATAERAVGVPITFRPFAIFGPAVPDAIRRLLDLPGYWLYVVCAFPAVAVAGAMALKVLVAKSEDPERRRAVTALALLAAAGLVISWLLVSTILNNDLGWRAALPAAMVLTVFAAAGLARWLAPPRRLGLAATAVVFAIAGLPDGVGFIRDNAQGLRSEASRGFSEASALWQAVRRHSAPTERVANNPLFLADLVRWPVNISWALLADRPSCFASWDLVRPYAALPAAEADALSALVTRVFAGDASASDIAAFASRLGCRVVVVMPGDGAWSRDVLAASGLYRLVEENPGRWRIYRARDAGE